MSTASSSGSDIQTSPPSLIQGWERFDEDEVPGPDSVDRPPLPPPRSELEILYSTPAQPSVELIIESPTVKTSTNPFEASETEGPRSKSPFEDFSSSIAEALLSNSEQKQAEDPVSASALATAGKELFETIEEEESAGSVLESFDSQVSSSITPVLLPGVTTVSGSSASQLSSQPSTVSGGIGPVVSNPVSSGSATSDVDTTQLRTNLHPVNPHHRSNSMIRLRNASILRPIPHEGTFSADSIANNTNPFYSGSINAGNYPQLTPLSQKPSGPRSPSYLQNFPLPGSTRSVIVNSHDRRPGRPPPKPQPYSGECQWSEAQESSSNPSNNVVIRSRQNSAAFMVQRLPSLGNFDPFGDFLGSDEDGMAGYVFENTNTSPL